MMKSVYPLLFPLLFYLGHSAYCPLGREHRHLGARKLKYFLPKQNVHDGDVVPYSPKNQEGGRISEDDSSSRYISSVLDSENSLDWRNGPSYAKLTQEPPSHFSGQSSTICPRGCVCTYKQQNCQVVCSGNFRDHFPVDQVPENTTVLRVIPKLGINTLNLGPSLRQLNSLQELRIIHSTIPNIGQRTLWGLKGLKILDLSFNNITRIVEYNFDGLSSLRQLNLADNSISSIPSAAFHHVEQLESLSLAGNQISDLATRIFYKLNALKTLDLSRNNLLVIDQEIFMDIRNLQEFVCVECGLRSLKIEFSLRHLRVLNLAGNMIQSFLQIEPHILRTIKNLDLSRNQINLLTALEIPAMETLHLEKNNITEMDRNPLEPSSKLRELNIAFNNIRDLSGLFLSSQPSLQVVDISGNMLNQDQVQSLLNLTPGLTSLQAAGLGLVSVSPSIFQGTEHLEKLNLSSNLLTDLQPGLIEALPRLVSLDLSLNLFGGLEAGFFNSVSSSIALEMVYLQGNPWICNECKIGPLLDWLDKSLMYWGTCFLPSSSSCLRCAEPSNLRRTPVSQLVRADLNSCSDPQPGFNSMTADVSTWSQFTVIAAVATVSFVITLTVVSRYRHYGVYLTGEKESSGGLEEILDNPVYALDRNQDSYVNLKYPSPI